MLQGIVLIFFILFTCDFFFFLNLIRRNKLSKLFFAFYITLYTHFLWAIFYTPTNSEVVKTGKSGHKPLRMCQLPQKAPKWMIGNASNKSQPFLIMTNIYMKAAILEVYFMTNISSTYWLHWRC